MKTIQELTIDRGELIAAREKLCAEKTALQTQVGDLNARCAIRLQQNKFSAIQTQRADLVRRIYEKENEISQANAALAEIHTAYEIQRSEVAVKRFEVRQLVQLRDQWHEFSMDPDHHQKAREVAWKFSQELRSILKRHFDQNSQSAP